MVASVSALTSSAQASSYYEADDYYADGGLSPSEWHGKGAEELGLSGDVDRDAFRELLNGKVAGQQLGTVRDGQLEHRPGWDVTLSAPKSVSIMAEVAGDRRLIAAHGQAVKTALAHVEAHMAATRVRQGGSVMREATGNLVVASCQWAPKFPQMWAVKIPYVGGCDVSVISRELDLDFPSLAGGLDASAWAD